jgi:hypothetical protein
MKLTLLDRLIRSNFYSVYKRYTPKLFNIIFKVYRIKFLRTLNVKSFRNEDFPLDEFGRVAFYKYPFYRDPIKKQDYFAQFYRERFVTDTVVDITKFSDHMAEILKGDYKNKGEHILEINSPSLVPVSLVNRNTDINDGALSFTINQKSVVLEGLKQNSFHYFPVKEEAKIKITSKDSCIIGNPIAINQKSKNNKKLVITLFVDGLSSKAINNITLPDLMPNTNEFFRDGAKFYNCFSASEWTLSSVASITSGLFAMNHGVTNPRGRIEVGCGYKLLGEYFQENGYLTSQICNNHRKNPSYGYAKGFDRSLYKRHMACDQVITSALEHLDTFSGRDNYLWLSFFDLHHHLDFIPDISSQKNNNLDDHTYKANVLNSVFLDYDQKLVNWYINEIRRLDRYLKILFDYINSNFEFDDVLISLVSDHGQAYMGRQKELLSEQKLMTPMMFVGGGVKPIVSNEIIQNIDYLPTLLSLANIENNYEVDGRLPCSLGGDAAREYSFSESIYPYRPYHAAIYDKQFMFYLTSNETMFDKDSCDINNCAYKLIDRIDKKDRTISQQDLVKKYLNHITNHCCNPKINTT